MYSGTFFSKYGLFFLHECILEHFSPVPSSTVNVIGIPPPPSNQARNFDRCELAVEPSAGVRDSWMESSMTRRVICTWTIGKWKSVTNSHPLVYFSNLDLYPWPKEHTFVVDYFSNYLQDEILVNVWRWSGILLFYRILLKKHLKWNIFDFWNRKFRARSAKKLNTEKCSCVAMGEVG